MSSERESEKQSTLYFNGTIHTGLPGATPARAMLVRGDRIEVIVPDDAMTSNGAGARRVDLHGCTVIAGFNDSHAHVLSFGLSLQQLDVSADAVHTAGDIVRAVAQRADLTGEGQWIHGRGYNNNELAENRHITRYELDGVSGGRPVVLDHTTGHVLVCNSEALRRAGIDANTPDPAGGRIARDDHGEASGLLEESAMELLRRVVPSPSRSEGRAAIEEALRVLATFGITSVSDAWTGGVTDLDDELSMYTAATLAEVNPRVTLMPLIASVAPVNQEGVRARESFDVGQHPNRLHVGATKIFSDGALSTRTAAMQEPYADDPSNTGVLFWEKEALVSSMRRAHDAGWQIATHALGDRAVSFVVDCYEEVVSGNPRPDHRHRIEHCMYADDTLVARIAALQLVPSLQPDIYRLGDAYVNALGRERAAQSIPTGSFREHRVTYAFSSDLPVIPGRPLDVIRSAMERRTPKGVVLGPEHRVTARDAIRSYTWGGAYATHTESFKGTLAPGMLADFIVLPGDPLSTDLDGWDDLSILATVIGGHEVYSA